MIPAATPKKRLIKHVESSMQSNLAAPKNAFETYNPRQYSGTPGSTGYLIKPKGKPCFGEKRCVLELFDFKFTHWFDAVPPLVYLALDAPHMAE